MTDLPQFSFKSYCWAIGTTSFRTVDFNVRIERQIVLLNEFWTMPKNENKKWSGNKQLQIDYYRFMQEKGFVSGDAPRPEKDAREKTSGLVAIGLIDDERRLTSAGRALLNLTSSGDFSSNNLLQIAADSFVYLKQLLKTSNNVDGDIVRPYSVLAYALLNLGHLTDDEFTYLLPLCSTLKNTNEVVQAIKDLRNGNGDIDEVIKSRLFAMDNYKSAFDYFLKQHVTESVITTVGMNRKSGGTGQKAYDKPYYPFYKTLCKIALKHDGDAVLALYKQSQQIKNKPGTLWRQYLFNTTAQSKLKRDGLSALNNVPLLQATSERKFKKLFFEQMHLFKAKATLSDYADLNRRYFKTTDTVIFADEKVEFDVLP
ncbi:MAG: AlwI family type II restriction endonuclease, partial [Victivallales bacterium]|nr:AlwI family type II restriction endonuclease [Victivallales bacterium]